MDMQTQAVSFKPSFLKHHTVSSVYLLVGATCMVFAGFLLTLGLSQFSGDVTAKRALIGSGILFQIVESLCFIAAFGFKQKLYWRAFLFLFGAALFAGSIFVMTLAQKAAMEGGEIAARAIDERSQYLRDQIQSLDESIASYRLNAEKQSNSVYANSRQLGQDSINRAVELEAEKRKLSDELFALTQQRQTTSSDFFKRIESVTGWSAKNTEFYFLFGRSFLIELCGISMISFGASRRRDEIALSAAPTDPDHRRLKPTERPTEATLASAAKDGSGQETASIEAHDDSDPTGLPLPSENDVFIEPEPLDEHIEELIDKMETALYKPNKNWANENVRQLRELRINIEGVDEQQETEQMTIAAYRLHQDGDLTNVGRDSIRKAFKEHYDKNIGSRKAMEISKLLKKMIAKA